MRHYSLSTVAIVLPLAAFWAAKADEVRYYEQDGMTYRETRQVIQRPIIETRLQESKQTLYHEELATEYRDTQRTWWTPVTQYQCETHLVGRWNPFVEPYFENRFVPRTRWEQRCETVKVPVACRRLVPETRTVQMPVATQRMVSEEVITRVAVGAARPRLSSAPDTQAPSAKAALDTPIGGVARLDSGPPRYGSEPGWRASTTR